MYIKLKTLINLAFFFALFPFFKVVPFIEAEIQPIGVAFAGLYLLCKKNKKLDISLFIFFLIVSTYFLISIILPVFIEEHTFLVTVETLITILTPLIYFLAFKDNLHLISKKLFFFSMNAWALFGTLQMFAPGLLRALFIDKIFGVLISRFNVSSVDDVRGVAMFAPEPSYAGYVILFMVIFSIFLYRSGQIKRSGLLYSVVLFLWMTFLNKSGTLIIFSILFVLPIVLSYMFSIKRIWLFVVLVLGTIAFFPLLTQSSSRPVQMLLLLFSYILNGQISLDVFLDFNNMYGSGRFAQTLAGYYNIFLTYGFGSGLGSWKYQITDTMATFGIPIFDAKPFSYASLVSFDMGIVGLLSLTVFLGRFVFKRMIIGRRISGFGLSCLFLSLFGIYISAPTSLPLFWLILLIYYHDRHPKTGGYLI